CSVLTSAPRSPRRRLRTAASARTSPLSGLTASAAPSATPPASTDRRDSRAWSDRAMAPPGVSLGWVLPTHRYDAAEGPFRWCRTAGGNPVEGGVRHTEQC